MDKFKLSWRQIRIHWGDSLLAVMGIALATAILAGIISLIGSYNKVFDRFTQQPQARQITVKGQFQAMGTGEAAVRIDTTASEPVRFNLQDVPRILEDNPDIIASYQARYMRFTTTTFGGGAAAGSGPGAGPGGVGGFEPPELMGVNQDTAMQVVDTPLLEQVQGYMASASFFTAYELKVQEGILFDDRDVTQSNAVAVVGAELAKKLYADKQVLNKKIRLNGRIYTIVGVLVPYAYSTEGLPVSFDELIFVPTREGTARTGGAGGGANAIFFGRVGELSFTARKGADIAMVSRNLEAFYTKLYGANKVVAETQISKIKKDLDKRLKILSLLALMASAVGIAASINIFNLMIGRVSRRTRSIAIQRSLGATSRSMLIQTLIETLILGMIGSVIGFVLSFPIAKIVQSILEKSQLRGMVLPQRFDLSFEVSVMAIVIACLFAVPAAFTAANTDIVDALREE
ncbi:ABC transporter permease [Gracilinema caldarium]|uniref:ABC transporter permease n=1 Tax=Gracilinema caldarium (strain ATCC 51460 / DSM 7334 / H1) TaxID=744872 RepID=F8EXW5_GRAC1|nr:ABC transporter permease [Gracilinema caldarium]AEJ20129.1 protein of unknown function DUF214 [Gracilinema caldarium DSM 7334]